MYNKNGGSTIILVTILKFITSSNSLKIIYFSSSITFKNTSSSTIKNKAVIFIPPHIILGIRHVKQDIRSLDRSLQHNRRLFPMKFRF